MNLFVQDMPRLSVDIDVAFTDYTFAREAALQAIGADLNAARSAISTLGHGTAIPETKGGDEVKLLVESRGVQVKVEVNHVFRGAVLPIRQSSLVQAAQDLFTTDITLPVLDTAELYGSKLVAAMWNATTLS